MAKWEMPLVQDNEVEVLLKRFVHQSTIPQKRVLQAKEKRHTQSFVTSLSFFPIRSFYFVFALFLCVHVASVMYSALASVPI